ncbi:MAG: SMP-30/gluconolactonase/LRE family protein [Sphingobacterium sp.]|uniref:SMP-30/gluconolactonase/LRE family protein n=1 Tax=Sphingobacterium sp. JB170 TaxID=1434842 RepID=UPI00097F0D7E|nr:SMP-30/gluconolactonase/LRE family protein [Sphingobacterium sp. JB170]SJN44726.1 Gluconolactonase [Sphingobacterium sp. JB170]
MKNLCLLILLCNTVLAWGQDKGEVILISGDFSFTEGPARDSLGNIYFTDQPNNRIWKYSSGGQLSLFLEPAGRSNGLYIDQEGYIIACADQNNELWRISTTTKQKEVLVKGYKSKKLNGPNDLWISKQGIIYLSDPYYQRSYWTRTKSELPEAVYKLVGTELQNLDADFGRPNGIVGSPDGTLLYVADIGASKTYVYDILDDGALANKKLFCARGSDGMTVDQNGNLYLTGDGVFVYNAQGEQIKHIRVPAKWTANVCFGGSNNEYLFITASEKVFKIYPDWL